MEWAGFLLHPPVRQLGEVERKSGSSRGILTEVFQRGESGNIEGGSLTQFPRDGGELTNFRDDF